MAETKTQAISRRRRERETFEAEEARTRHSTASTPAYVQRRGRGLGGALREGVLQGDTALRSAANTLTLDTANSLAAGLDSLVPVGGQGIGERYAANLAAERARDSYDAAHRPMAQRIGAGAATALSLLAGSVAGPRRLAGAATLSAREAAAILGAGGASGLALQNLSDAAAHRSADWRDGAGATLGGVLGAAALPLGPGRAAAVGAATTTAAQDLLHGRPISLEDLGRSAAAGRAIGGLAGFAGRQGSRSLSPQAKGWLGESLGTVRSAINHMEREAGPKKLFKPKGWTAGTIPDGRSGDILFEDKFGPKAALSAGQRMAQAVLGPNYVLYHFHPEDVGKILGLPVGGPASRAANQPPTSDRARPRSAR
jgi:hypothetical protein